SGRRSRRRKSGRPFERREEDRQETGFQKQDVPLVTQKNPADIEQRKVEQPEQNQNGNRRYTGDEQQRQHRAAPTEESKTTIARVPPAKRRDAPKTPRPLDSFRQQKVARGQDAPIANQAVDLRRQRNERREINQTEQTQKQPTGEEIGSRSHSPVGEFPGLHGKPVEVNFAAKRFAGNIVLRARAATSRRWRGAQRDP